MDIQTIPSPCYVIEESLLRRNLTLIKDVKERAGIEIIMALKAFAMWKVFPIVREYIPYATASSVYEARLVYEELGTPAHTYSPAYTEADFPHLLKCSSHITFNSLSQFERFYPMVVADGRRISCGLRINPEYSDVATDLYNPCAPGSRMGITSDKLPDQLPEGVEGLHFHTLCESSAQDLANTLQAVEQRFGRWLSQVRWLNMGGGHLMTRKGYDIDFLLRLLKEFILTSIERLKVIHANGNSSQTSARSVLVDSFMPTPITVLPNSLSLATSGEKSESPDRMAKVSM